MIDPKDVKQQLKALHFDRTPWNQPEVSELPNVLHPGEKIAECVNGWYENGIALLVVTDSRLLLIDKKPLNFLNVEDLRFEMINEIDYAHRMLGASITITTGNKVLKFRSYNQQRLRHLISLMQQRMSEVKNQAAQHAEGQQQRLAEINRQLQTYLLAQQQQIERLMRGAGRQIAPLKPDPSLSDYLFAQRLLEQMPADQRLAAANAAPTSPDTNFRFRLEDPVPVDTAADYINGREVGANGRQLTPEELADDARHEIFGRALMRPAGGFIDAKLFKGIEINPLRVAYSKLPMALRRRAHHSA